ncbi:MAG: hypothetical protein COA63_009055 [Methylophaga sp.]|nr:hypothetical protein [Methylophaga sp.]
MFKNILYTAVILFAVGLAGVAQSAPLSREATEFNACTSSADQEVTISADGSSSSCCSKSLGYCMSCGHIACVKTDYPTSGTVLDKFRPKSAITRPDSAVIAPTPKPPSLREQIKSQPTMPTSTKAMDSDNTSTVKPIKQYQQIKANPTTTDKALRK